jgi:hypothetical protein
MTAWADLREKALFGLIDGLNGAVGLVIGLLHSHAAASLIFVALLARAGSSSVSMAGAQYEADDSTPDQAIRWGRVAAMGVGYLASALVPGILAAITWTRSRSTGWLKAAVTTVVIFALAVGAGLLASLVAG